MTDEFFLGNSTSQDGFITFELYFVFSNNCEQQTHSIRSKIKTYEIRIQSAVSIDRRFKSQG